MEYKKISLQLTPFDETASEILMAQMGDLGFESFVENENGFDAYIPSKLFDKEALSELDPMVENVKYSWQDEVVPDQNWNKVWEDNFFEPIVIGEQCLIRSQFHQHTANARYEIIINPQMAFGTGHHQTTSLMVRFLLKNYVDGKKVLDMGCGTGILGILASMRGASSIHGIDIDQWCYDNAMSNIQINNITNMTVAVGDAKSIVPTECYDVILANINRNILLSDMPYYVKALAPEGELYVSGFYDVDVHLLEEKANSLGLKLVDKQEDTQWTAIKFVRQ